MAIASRPSEITLPAVNQGWPDLLAFLCWRFPRIERQVWLERFAAGKVFWFDGPPATATCAFLPSRRLCYFREVSVEHQIPFAHQLLYQDDEIVVACKPHFLPVIPGGNYVNECLLERLRQQLQLADLVPVHRLDRETAGLVLFSKRPQTRAAYYELFSQGKIHKSYQAVAALPAQPAMIAGQCWQIENRLEKSEPRFLMHEVPGPVNAQSTIELLACTEARGLFRLNPLTGKTHQLRLHMLRLGVPILHDKYYPRLLPKGVDDFNQPLQLLAQQLAFRDPITGVEHLFLSHRKLSESWL